MSIAEVIAMMRFRLLSPVLVAVSFLTMLSFGLLRGEARRVPGPTSSAVARNPVLIELFTSEGCSSCPPADVLLAQLDRFQPVPSADLIVLSEHVDYWDDIGWKDPYSSHQFSLRQADYARRFRLGEPYTPQMVVDGNSQLVGSDERQAVQAIQNAAKVDKFRISLSAPRLEANSLTVHVEVGETSGAGAKHTSGQVWIALADDMDQSNVRRGENAGRILKHVAVVRTLAQVGTVEGNSTFSKDLTVSAGNANLQNLRVVAILQESATGKVLGVGSTRFSN
jgi:hypothetical protein